MTKIKEICSFQSGGTPTKGNPNFFNGNIPWITTVALNGEIIDEKNAIDWITEEAIRKSAAKIVPAGSIMVGTRVGIGKVAINRIEMSTSQDIVSLINIDETKWDKTYLCAFLTAHRETLVSQARGATIKGIKIEALADLELPEIPLKLQQIQSQNIKEVTELIKKRTKEIDLLEKLVKSRFIEMFGDPVSNPMGWMRKTLQQLVTVEPQNGLYKPQSDYVQDETGIPILRIDAFYDGKVTDFKNLKRLVCSDAEKERYLLKENDIVINRVNSIEYLGKCAHITGMHEDTVFESNMMRFHLDEEQTDAVFITHLLCSKYIYNQILRTAKKAVNQASINQKDVLGFEVYVPPLELQQQFTTFVTEVAKSKLSIQQSLQELLTLKKSLMQQYFG